MKTLVKLSAVVIACFFSGIAIAQQNLQNTKQMKIAEHAAALKTEIDNKTYTFIATYAQPLKGGQKYLTSDYDLRIAPDSAIAFLPYFGQTYQNAPLTPEESAIMFTSTKFDYKVEPTKKGGWTITITPDNVKFVSKLQLDVYPNGKASLTVLSNFRDMIRFDGEIKEKL